MVHRLPTPSIFFSTPQQQKDISATKATTAEMDASWWGGVTSQDGWGKETLEISNLEFQSWNFKNQGCRKKKGADRNAIAC